MAVVLFISVSCSQDDKIGGEEDYSGSKTDSIEVVLLTGEATNIGYASATLNATYSIDNAEIVEGVAVFYYGMIDDVETLKVSGKKVVSDMLSDKNESFDVTITDLEPLTHYYYVACITINNIEYYGSVKSFITDHEYVDLGLSVKWATCNVGASRPEEYGDYYAWGETEVKNDYCWNTYKWCKGSDVTLIKYCLDGSNGYNGYIDDKVELELDDDVAHVKWGGSWRMPTKCEQAELLDNCTWDWVEENGVNGYRVTSNMPGFTDSSIFLPVAGYRSSTSLSHTGSIGYYWSSSLDDDMQVFAWYINFNSANDFSGSFSRVFGQSVRPVCQ